MERRISTPDHVRLINIIRENLFTTAVEVVAVSNFPGTSKTAYRRLIANGSRSYVLVVQKIGLNK